MVPNETATESSSTAQPGGGKAPKGVHIITEKNGTKRIVVDDDDHKKAVKATKKKTSKPSPSPTPSSYKIALPTQLFLWNLQLLIRSLID